MIYVYIIAAILAAGIGGGADHFVLGQPKYDKLQSQFDGYKAQQAALTAQQQAAYAAGLAKQLAEFQGTIAHNAQVMKDLQDENVSIAADRDFARRLLNAARASTPAAAPAAAARAGSGPLAAGVSADPGNGSLAGELADAAGECRDSMQRLAALQSEVIPQTKVNP